MILKSNEIQPEDVRHLHCSDPRLKREVAKIKRYRPRQVEPPVLWVYAEPALPVTIKPTRPAA